jgi:hypothetical protein
MKLIVDANVFISALIGGKAAELLFNPNFELLTTERTTWEVKKYIPELAAHTEKSPEDLLLLFELIPARECQSKKYESSLSVAQHYIGDRDKRSVFHWGLDFYPACSTCPVGPADRTGVESSFGCYSIGVKPIFFCLTGAYLTGAI